MRTTVESAAAVGDSLVRTLDLLLEVAGAGFRRSEDTDEEIARARELTAVFMRACVSADQLADVLTDARDHEPVPSLATALNRARTLVVRDVRRRLDTARHMADSLADHPGMDYRRGYAVARVRAHESLLPLASALEQALTQAVQLAAETPPSDPGPDYARDFSVASTRAAELSARLRQSIEEATETNQLLTEAFREHRELAAACAEALALAAAE